MDLTIGKSGKLIAAARDEEASLEQVIMMRERESYSVILTNTSNTPSLAGERHSRGSGLGTRGCGS